MSFDEQPYSKEDRDLHDACEEIKRLTADLARVTGERDAWKVEAIKEGDREEVERVKRCQVEAALSPSPVKGPTIADLCHKCRNGENVFRGEKEWVHGGFGNRVRCDASDKRDAAYGKVPANYNPKHPPAVEKPCDPPCSHLHAKGFDPDSVCSCGHEYGEHQNGPGACAEETGRCQCLKFSPVAPVESLTEDEGEPCRHGTCTGMHDAAGKHRRAPGEEG